MAQLQSKNPPNKWSEVIEDLWEHLSHFKDKEKLLPYDENCLKLDCITLQFVDGEDSTSSDSVTWLDQKTLDMDESLVEIDEKNEST